MSKRKKEHRKKNDLVRVPAPDGPDYPPISYGTSRRLICEFRKHVRQMEKLIKSMSRG